MTSRNIRKSILHQQISNAQSELRDLWNEERIEKNREAIGKCFCTYADVGNRYTQYICVMEADEYGNLWGYYIKIFDEGVLFSIPRIGLEDADQLGYSVDKAEFIKIFNFHYKQIMEGDNAEDNR
jgi:hypothetical protein